MCLWSPVGSSPVACDGQARSRSRAGCTSSDRNGAWVHAARGAPATTRRVRPQSALQARPIRVVGASRRSPYAFEAPPSVMCHKYLELWEGVWMPKIAQEWRMCRPCGPRTYVLVRNHAVANIKLFLARHTSGWTLVDAQTHHYKRVRPLGRSWRRRIQRPAEHRSVSVCAVHSALFRPQHKERAWRFKKATGYRRQRST